MDRVIEVVSTWPTVGFTALLIVFLTWWLVSLIVSGIDGDFGGDLDADMGGDIDADLGGDGAQGTHTHTPGGSGRHLTPGTRRASTGRSRTRRGLVSTVLRATGLGSTPLSLGLTVFSFGAWSASLLATLTWRDRLIGGTATAAGLGTVALALVVGSIVVRRFAALMAPVFEDNYAPVRSDGAGAQARIRTTYVDETFGQAEILTGPTRHSIVKVRAPAQCFVRGDIVLIVGYDAASDSFDIAELDPVLRNP